MCKMVDRQLLQLKQLETTTTENWQSFFLSSVFLFQFDNFSDRFTNITLYHLSQHQEPMA